MPMLACSRIMRPRHPRLPWLLAPLALGGWLPAAPAPDPVGPIPVANVAAAPVARNGLVPCVVRQRVPVKFPVRAFHEGVVYGEASLMVEVHSDGQLGDVLAVSHSGFDFAEAARHAVQQWEFIPATFNGEPIASIITVNVVFSVEGTIAYTKLIGQSSQEPIVRKRDAYRAFNLMELDGVPSALARPGPVYPKEWAEQGKTGSVTIEFFIDEAGETRFPQVVGEADELLAAAAIEAVKSWRFDPPMRFGRPVLAVVRQVFYFRPDSGDRS